MYYYQLLYEAIKVKQTWVWFKSFLLLLLHDLNSISFCEHTHSQETIYWKTQLRIRVNWGWRCLNILSTYICSVYFIIELTEKLALGTLQHNFTSFLTSALLMIVFSHSFFVVFHIYIKILIDLINWRI